MKDGQISATQEAAIKRIKILMKEYAFAMRSSFLYTREELLKTMEKDLTNLDEEYINKYKIPGNVVKELAKEVYDMLMEKKEYDKAITIAEHYKL